MAAALAYVRQGDTLIVWWLDRLGRSLPHPISTMIDLEERGIGFKSLTENIDTTTSGGKLIFHIFGALAELSETSFGSELRQAYPQPGPEAEQAVGQKS